MIELRNDWSYFKDPRESPPLQRREWQRSYLCIGGIRFIIKPCFGRRKWGVDWSWRWSWRGLTLYTGPLIVATGWMAPQFRENN